VRIGYIGINQKDRELTLAGRVDAGSETEVVYERGKTLVAAMSPCPVNINTAPIEVLYAVMANLHHRLAKEAEQIVTPDVAWRIAEDIVRTRKGKFSAVPGTADGKVWRKSGPFCNAEDFGRFLKERVNSSQITRLQEFALYTTLPTIAGVTLPLGWLIGGLPGAAAAFASGLLTTCFYEYCHCVQHLKYLPKSRFLRRIKQLHMAHHFHNEHGNYGITNFAWDRVFGTLYQGPKDMARSPTVFNLGYDAEQAKRYPWVAQISERRGHFKAKPEDRTTPPAEHNPVS